MKTETLEQEKFDTLKELVDIQGQISFGRAELDKLIKTTEEYMVVREKEAEDRVIKVLKKSREALEATTANHRELSSYNSELKAYANELTGLTTDITALFQDFKDRMKEADEDMAEHHKSVSDILRDTKVERMQIIEDRKMLERERADIEIENRKIVDEHGRLQRGFAELKGKLK